MEIQETPDFDFSNYNDEAIGDLVSSVRTLAETAAEKTMGLAWRDIHESDIDVDLDEGQVNLCITLSFYHEAFLRIPLANLPIQVDDWGVERRNEACDLLVSELQKMIDRVNAMRTN